MAQVRSWNMFPKAQSNEIKKRLKGEFEGYLRQKKYENFVDSFLKIAVDGEVSDAIFDGSLYINFEDHTGKPIFESTLEGGLNSHIRVVNQSSNKTFFLFAPRSFNRNRYIFRIESNELDPNLLKGDFFERSEGMLMHSGELELRRVAL